MKKEFEAMPNLETKKKMVYKQGKGMWDELMEVDLLYEHGKERI